MAKTNCVFKRIEKKYLIPREKADEFLARIAPYVLADEYPSYTISNIYYDTDTFELIRASIEKPEYKEKLRLRSYGRVEADGKVFLELKKKFKDTVFKRRVVLKNDEATRYLSGKSESLPLESQIMHEIDYFRRVYDVSPKLYLAYERTAFRGKEDDELRITLDKNLTARTTDLDLSSGVYGDIRELESENLIEIKTASAFPLWLADVLCDMKIYPTSYSKYGTIYKKYLFKFWRKNLCLKAS